MNTFPWKGFQLWSKALQYFVYSTQLAFRNNKKPCLVTLCYISSRYGKSDSELRLPSNQDSYLAKAGQINQP